MRLISAIRDGGALDGKLLKTLPSGRFKSIAGTVELSKLRTGNFDVIDPVGGFVHESPTSDWTVQGAYLKELKGLRFMSLLLWRMPRTIMLRMAILSGVDTALSSVKQLLEHLAIICALLMTVVHVESFQGITPELCESLDDGNYMCSTQVDAANYSMILCITNVTYCVVWIGVMSFRPIESAAYRLHTEYYRMVFLPVVLMIAAFVAFGWAFSTRIIIQAIGLQPFRLPVSVFFFAFWPTLCLVVLAVATWASLTELKQRDLDPSRSGFSDSFLHATGVYPSSVQGVSA